MRKFSALAQIVMALAVVLSTTVYSQMQPNYTGRLATTHDGSVADEDDVMALSMEYAIIASFGMQKKLVHVDFGNIIWGNPLNDKAQYDAMIDASKGYRHFPGFDSSVVFDDRTNLKEAVANFKKQAEAGSANNILTLSCCGPMEVAWQHINATAPDKRKFVRCISHAPWNDNTVNGDSHNWADIQADFVASGLVCTHIANQNGNLGGKGSAVWDFLKSMPTNTCIPASAFAWLRTKDYKQNGDCSDAGMMCFTITGGNQGVTPTDLAVRFKNPICGTSIAPVTLNVPASSPLVNCVQAGNYLTINVAGMKGSGVVSLFDLSSKLLSKGHMADGVAEITVGSHPQGTYVLKIKSNGRDVMHKVVLR